MRNIWKRRFGVRILGSVLAAGMVVSAAPAAAFAAPASANTVASLASTAGTTALTKTSGTPLTTTSDLTVMEVGSVYDLSVEPNGTWCASFTAPEDGEYAFVGYSDEEMVGELYGDEDLEEWLDDESARDFVLKWELKKGQTVYLAMSAYDGDGMEGKLEVVPFSITDLKYAQINADPSSTTINEGAVQVCAHVYSYNYEYLEEGTDYELVFVDEDGKEYDAPPAKVGHYKLYARGIGEYTGVSRKTPYDVVEKNDLSVGRLNCAKDWLLDNFTGVKAEVYDYDDNLLTEGKDYELRYVENCGGNFLYEGSTEAPTEPGVWEVYAKAIGSNYTGRTDLWQFHLYDPYDIENPGFESYEEARRFRFQWNDDNYIEYTGYPVIIPPSRMWYVENELEFVLREDTDYHLVRCEDADGKTLKENPVMPGIYYAVFAGNAPYKGETKQEFYITGDLKDLSYAKVKLDEDCYDESGQPVELIYNVYEYNTDEISSSELTPVYYDENGTKLSEAPTKAGIYQVAFVPVDGSEYKNETPKVRFEICGPNNIRNRNYIEGAFANGHILVYTGQPQDPPSINFCRHLDGGGSEYLKPGTDYVLDHLEDEKGNVLSDLTVTELGKYWVVYKGINEYTGVVREEFDLVSDRDITYFNGKWETTAYIATNEGQLPKPHISLTYPDGSIVTLEEGKDFEFDHYVVDGESSNTLPTDEGHYSAVYRALEGFTGYKQIDFYVIDPYDISNYEGTFGDQWQIEAGTKLPDATFSRMKADGTKQTLTQGTEFVFSCIKYYDEEKDQVIEMSEVPQEPGWYTAVYVGNVASGFTGEAKIEFEVVKKEPIDISKARVTLVKTSVPYNGQVQKPSVKYVVVNSIILTEGTDYTVKMPSGCTNVGPYVVTITGKGAYTGTAKATFTIRKKMSKISLEAQSKTYNGKAQAYNGSVKKTGSTGKVTFTYYSDAKGTKQVKAGKVKNAGTYYVRATLAGDANYEGTTSDLVKFKITKVKNTLTVKAPKSKTIKYEKLKKKDVALTRLTANVKFGKATFSLTGVKASSYKKYFKINTKNGKLTVKKGLKKGTYTVTVKVTVKGNANYIEATKNVKITITVK